MPDTGKISDRKKRPREESAAGAPVSDSISTGLQQNFAHKDSRAEQVVKQDKKGVTVDATVMKGPDSARNGKTGWSRSLPAKKKKGDIENLADFIAYAYFMKGKKLSITQKLEKTIGKHSRLESETRAGLLALAREDVLLAVPCGLWLAVRDITAYPGVKREVLSFFEEVLRNHPVFSIPGVAGALDNNDEGIGPKMALSALAALDFTKAAGLASRKPLKSKDYETLRINATYCLALWFMETRHLSIRMLNDYLFAALWQPKAEDIHGETAQLHALTNISDLAGVGLACQSFKRELDGQVKIAESAKRDQQAALERLQALTSSNKELQRDIEQRDKEISRLREALHREQRAHENTRMHLGNDLELLRTRLLRRLKAEASLLEEGLHALRRDPPKIHVMEDHGERVLDGLKKEIKELDLHE